MAGTDLPVQALPFGLFSALWVSTKVLVPVFAHIRKQEIQIFIYLDNILMGNSCREVEWAVEIALEA